MKGFGSAENLLGCSPNQSPYCSGLRPRHVPSWEIRLGRFVQGLRPLLFYGEEPCTPPHRRHEGKYKNKGFVSKVS